MPTTPSNPVFAVGTVATYQLYDAKGDLIGTPIKFRRLRGLTPANMTRTVADVTDIEDFEIRRRPVRRDPGTLSLTLGLTDEAKADNQWCELRDLFEAGTIMQIVLNLPGTFDDTGTDPNIKGDIFIYDGFISGLGQPDVSAGSDEMLTYSLEFQRTKF